MKTSKCSESSVEPEQGYLSYNDIMKEEGVYLMKGNSTLHHIVLKSYSATVLLKYDTSDGLLNISSLSSGDSSFLFKKTGKTVCFELRDAT